ncbi:hypothetical protein [Salmonella phage SD-6_S16]|nr:hypothetical protein [Salmonella phage SD-6_S16]
MEGRSSYCIIYYFEFCLFRRINLIKPRVGIGAALQSSSSCLVVFLLTFILCQLKSSTGYCCNSILQRPF